MREGRLARATALHFTQAHAVFPEAFRDAEHHLLAAVDGLHATHARRAVNTWIERARAMLASAAPDPTPPGEEPSTLTFTDLLHGRVRLTAELDPLAAQAVRTAIENLTTKDADTDEMMPLCWGHHPIKHRDNWTIWQDPDGTVHAQRPDGHTITDHRRRTNRPQPPNPTGHRPPPAPKPAKSSSTDSNDSAPTPRESFPGLLSRARRRRLDPHGID